MLNDDDDECVLFVLVGRRQKLSEKANAHILRSLSTINTGNICLTEERNISMENVHKERTLMVIGIDLGMTFSGYSFIFTRDQTKVRYMRQGKGKFIWKGDTPPMRQ